MRLAMAAQQALELLAGVPKNAEVSIAGIEDQILWLGMGFCVGKGWATYRGDYNYRITPTGRRALTDGIDAHT